MEHGVEAILNSTVVSRISATSIQNGSDVRWCPTNPEHGQDETYKHFYEMAQLITGLVIYPMVCFPGVVGNALTIFVLSRRNMQTSTNAFLSALAVADSIKLINDILYFFVIVFMRTSPRLGNLSYGYLYPYAHFVFSLSVCVSSWLTVSVAVERYILVCHPTRARALWSRRRAVILCSTIYIVMTSLALPSALRYRTIRCIDPMTNTSRLDVELTEMWQNEIFVTTYTWAQNLLRSIIPLIVLVVLNACIICALRRTRANRRQNARHRVTVMMLVVILAFLICITPDAILSTVFGFGYHEAGYLTKGIREITDTLLAINAGVNFLIYCAFNQVFRKSFARNCCPKKRRPTNNWMTELDESTYRRLSEAKSIHTSNNNSPPRQDTPPTIVTDQSPTGNNSGVTYLAPSDRDGGSSSDYGNDENQSLRYSGLGQIKDYESSADSQLQDQHLKPHTHRSSSSGLKKCRNSIKCNRAKNRGSVVMFSDGVDTFGKGRSENNRSPDWLTEEDEPSDELNDLDKDDDEDGEFLKDTTSKDVSQNVMGNGSAAYCKKSPLVSSKLYNNFLNNAADSFECKQLKNGCSSNKDSSSSFSDAQKLANLRNCDGTCVSSNVRFSQDVNDTANMFSKNKNIDDKVNKMCIKDGLQLNGKLKKPSVSFTERNSLDGDSTSLPTKGNNNIKSDSYNRGNKRPRTNDFIQLKDAGSRVGGRREGVPPSSAGLKSVNYSAGLAGETRNNTGSTPGTGHLSYVHGDILTTDL